MYNIAVCDDDVSIVRAIEIYLKGEGFNVLKAYNGNELIEILNNNKVEVVILDVMMPILDGIETLQIIRKTNDVPVIMLSAKSEDEDKIEGLNYGADDYVTKPFNPLELIARVKTNLRRYTSTKSSTNEAQNIYTSGELILDDDLKKVTLENKEIKFTPTEFNILKFLIQNKGKVFSISEIYNNVWQNDSFSVENIVSVHIRHIREKIEIDPKNPRYLKVIWGVGYKLENIN